jgi:hypothetical protein
VLDLEHETAQHERGKNDSCGEGENGGEGGEGDDGFVHAAGFLFVLNVENTFPESGGIIYYREFEFSSAFFKKFLEFFVVCKK